MPAGTVPVTLGSTSSRCVDADGFLVTSVRFPPLLKLPLHTHERATVAIILHGSFDGLMRGSSHPCPQASVLTEPPGEPHGNLFERPARTCSRSSRTRAGTICSNRSGACSTRSVTCATSVWRRWPGGPLASYATPTR